ncbi:hypothetical protein BASA81_004188 [Batrachochytrium salamandrivorans]|nr:hypothetical protein BASA81_004188 [Batrachochytrium salamandrivorans]
MEPATPTNLAKRKSHAHGLLAAAQHESLRGFSDNELFYKGFSGMTQVETKWAEMRASTEVSDQEKLEALLDDEVLWEKRKQRNQDLSNDQYFQSPARLYLALVLLTLVHLIQIGAMYNLTGLSSYLVTDKIAIMLERGDWMTTNPLLLVAQHNASTFPDIVHGYLNSSEILLPGISVASAVNSYEVC